MQAHSDHEFEPTVADFVERAFATFLERQASALVCGASVLFDSSRDQLLALAAHYKLPAIYWDRFFVTSGGLMSYGPDILDNYRRAAGYVDRILKGEKPAEMPVQAPTKFDFVINLKTAKTLGLTVPATLLTRSDELIE